MKDEVYNMLKAELSRYHRRGYQFNYANTNEFYDEETKERGYHIELAVYKKLKRKPKYI